MATSQQFLVNDNSTAANFNAWGGAVSAFLLAQGWTQSSDTGQVNFSTNVSTPGSGAYFYQIFQPGDGLTNFFLKVEFGNVASQTNMPSFRISIGTGTNGSGTLTGTVMGPYITANGGTYTTGGSSSTFECDFSATTSRIGVLMWRNGTTNAMQFWAIERSVNQNGTYTGAYVTLWVAGVGGAANTDNSCMSVQQTLVFGVGVAPNTSRANGNTSMGFISRLFPGGSGTSSAFNNSIPFDTCTPMIGYLDYPCTVVGVAANTDIVEGVTFTVTIYGGTHTYMPTKNGKLNQVGPGGSAAFSQNSVNSCALCMRYD